MHSLRRWLSTHLYYRVLLVSATAILVLNALFFVFANVQNARETQRREATLHALVGHLLFEEDLEVVTAYLEHYAHVNGVAIVLLDDQAAPIFASIDPVPESDYVQIVYQGIPLGSIHTDFQRSVLGIEYAVGFLILNGASLAAVLFGMAWLKRYLNKTVAALEADLAMAGSDTEDFHFSEVADLDEKIKTARANEARQKANNDLAIRTLAHDVKTPLTAALLILEAIRTKRIPSDPSTWDELTEELRQIQAIVPKFLDVDPNEVPRAFDLSAFFPAFAERHREVFATKRMNVSLDLEPLSIEIAETDLTRLAEHLVFNAFYYGKEHGTITIRTRSATRVLEIEDDGIGMTQATLERIQNGPARGEEAAKLHANGLGQGIGIVRSIVTRIGAQMEIHSAAGVGTTVWIRFSV